MSKKIFVALLFGAVIGAGKLYAAGPPPPPPATIPLDGGISFLIVAGMAYGGKKIRDSRKKNS